MSSSLSPDRSEGAAGTVSSDSEDKNGFSSINLGFLKGLTDKKTTRDGNPAKKRGPKPNSKPALTRRQELNRQAQRTHRERKELYIKALEEEVLRLKEVFGNVSVDKDRLAEENRQLKEALVHSGIQVPSPIQAGESVGFSSTVSMSGSNAPGSSGAFTPDMTSQTTAPSVSSTSHLPSVNPQQPINSNQFRDMTQQVPNQSGMDYEQTGIDFVLTSAETGCDPCGHALMASCPPLPFTGLAPDVPFGTTNVPSDDTSGQQTWELTKGDLSTLLDLSKKLELDGEITPIMAWGMVMGHPRFRELQTGDFQKIAEELVRKVRCFGFGAVVEEFEVRDALENVLTWKPEMMVC